MSFHFRGTALGGWLVLEPWITPSLFYQFLGLSEKYGDKAPEHIALDSFTFCKALGKEEANRQLRQHWKTWVDENQIANLAKIGVDTLRIPVGDWMYVPYEPYIGCMDGALEELDRVLALCTKYNIRVLLDIHAMKDSQNGLDNSGYTGSMIWTSTLSTGGAARYQHWEIRGGNWIGDFNVKNKTYDTINYGNIEHSIKVVEALVHRHKSNPIVVGLEPVNEPWWFIPMDILQDFYATSNKIVQKYAPHWVTLLHDSFRMHHEIWGDFINTRCINCVMDSHLYHAWAASNPAEWFADKACEDYEHLSRMESFGIPMIVGEWSLATDNCAMWLNGLNDNVPGYPVVECERIPCPPPYMGPGQPGTPLDITKGPQDPFGEGGESYVINGTCPRDAPFPNDDQVMRKIAYNKLYAYDYVTHGHFFWNFRTEFEPRWDYQQAVARGWLPDKYDTHTLREISQTCQDPTYIPDTPYINTNLIHTDHLMNLYDNGNMKEVTTESDTSVTDTTTTTTTTTTSTKNNDNDIVSGTSNENRDNSILESGATSIYILPSSSSISSSYSLSSLQSHPSTHQNLINNNNIIKNTPILDNTSYTIYNMIIITLVLFVLYLLIRNSKVVIRTTKNYMRKIKQYIQNTSKYIYDSYFNCNKDTNKPYYTSNEYTNLTSHPYNYDDINTMQMQEDDLLHDTPTPISSNYPLRVSTKSSSKHQKEGWKSYQNENITAFHINI